MGLEPFYIFEKRKMSCFYHTSAHGLVSVQCCWNMGCTEQYSYHGDLYWNIHNSNIKTLISYSGAFLSICATEWYYKYTDIQQKIVRIHLNTLTSNTITITSSEILINFGIRIYTSISCELTKNEPPNLIRALRYSRLHNSSCVKLIKPSHKQIKI